jgi:predicted methyltransferase
MAGFAYGKVVAYVGPPGLGAADDVERVIAERLRGAGCDAPLLGGK